jgi:hypothetical protein
VVTVGGVPVTVNAGSELVIGSTTLVPGSPTVAVVAGTTFSIAPAAGTSALVIVVNGATTDTLALIPVPTAVAVVTLGGTTYTADSTGRVVIGGQTLAPGHAITVSGTVVSLPLGGASTPAPTAAAVVTLGGTTYTADSTGRFVIGGQTLAPGQVITVSGTVVSLPLGGTSTLSSSTGRYGGQVFQGHGNRARMPSMIIAMVMMIFRL